MTWGVAEGHCVKTAFRYAIAASSAALLLPGAELCHGADIKHLFHDVEPQRVSPNGLETDRRRAELTGGEIADDAKLKQCLG
jgi:hypothetical protein